MVFSVRTAILALIAASGTASAQECTWFVDDVPDFDQRRLNALPANGGMYCVPTSFTDWFAYLANRGVPQPLTLDGPRDWESSANYNRVSDTLTLMGGLMATDPADGTDLNNALDGAKFYSLLNLNSDLVFCGEYVWGGGEAPTPEKLLALMGGGADVVLSDMAANTTGHRKTDQLRIVGLIETAAAFATDVLNPGGTFLAKAFQSGADAELVAQLKRDFASVRHVKPASSRQDSSERYVLAMGFRGQRNQL